MIVEFEDPDLEALYRGDLQNPRMGRDLLRSFRKVVNLLHHVGDDQELRTFKAQRLEKLKGDRAGQSSLRLHGGNRLIVRFRTDPQGRVVVVVEIVDYH